MKNPPINETQERRKSRLERTANELFADINNSFGKEATAKQKRVASAIAKTTTPKEDSLRTFMREANVIANKMESPTWKPVAIVHYIIKQKCDCCGKMPECMGGTLVRHSHRARKDTWDFPRPDIRELTLLPQIVIEETTPTLLCPDCIRQGYFERMIQRDEISIERKILQAQIETPDFNSIEAWGKDHEDSGEEILFGEEE